VFATDEHRLGLKPVLRRVWAPKGERPIALGHHRYKWLYVTAFTQPLSGETVWYVSTGVSKAFFAALLAAFAEETRAGRERSIVLVLDQAGWHTGPNLPVPDGIRLVYLPSYTPELQPAEHLWPVLDEPDGVDAPRRPLRARVGVLEPTPGGVHEPGEHRRTRSRQIHLSAPWG
jgi:hypothetical protein